MASTSRTMQAQCTACPYQKLVPHSCGHHHCPHCQHHESQQWLERQLQKQVPAAYCMAKGGHLLNHKALAKVFRAKLLAAIAAVGLTLPARYRAKWVVDCKAVGSGQPALIYLGRNLNRGVIERCRTRIQASRAWYIWRGS